MNNIIYNKHKEFLLSLNLINTKDENKYFKTLYSISNNIEKNYKIYKIKKHNGKYRTIYEPNSTLKHIQKQILVNILNKEKVSISARAYISGVNLKDNAILHTNKPVILKLDIKDFFESITFTNIYKTCFYKYPKNIGILLTYLCTYDDHLTQGSPTSPYISNLVMKEFDNELGKWCNSKDIAYTRYSDDMTFSGSFVPSEIIIKVRKMLYKLGLELNEEKIHVVKSSRSQLVTGLQVNKKVQVNIKYRNKIRQEVYYIKKYGISSHLERINSNIDVTTYLNSLYGRILYVLQINETKEFLEYKEFIKNTG